MIAGKGKEVSRNDWIACLLLAALTLIVFWRVGGMDFVLIDDDVYVYENPHIRHGLTGDGIAWAFSAGLLFQSPHADYWQPVTFLSRMLDIQCFGLNPGAHHLMNLALHVINTLLLFRLVRRMSGTTAQSFWVAAIFALHPLNVEPVAWVTARKDMLSGLFWMLTILAYFHHAERPSARRYALVLFLFVLGLMSKPVGVTLPFVLLLLDYWPLGRIRLDAANLRSWLRPIAKKIPLFLLIVASFVITLYRSENTDLGFGSAATTLGKVCASYGIFLGKMFWPHPLAVYYPYPENGLPAAQIIASAVVLGLISWGVLRWSRRAPFLFTGWFWFVIMLVPYVALNNITSADRYTYLPMIGLLIAAAWGVPLWIGGWSRAAGALTVALCFAVSMWQLGYWNNNITLFEHAIAVTSQNYLAHDNVGTAYLRQGRVDMALEQFRIALQIKPKDPHAFSKLGNTLVRTGKLDEAVGVFRDALRVLPHDPDILCNMGIALTQQGKLDEAMICYARSLEEKPNDPHVFNNIGITLIRQGKIEQAVELFLLALKLEPDYAEAHCNLGLLLAQQGHTAEAIRHLQAALALDPNLKPARDALEKLQRDLQLVW